MTISKTLLRELSISASIGATVELLFGFELFYLNGELERSYPYLELTQMPGHQIALILFGPFGFRSRMDNRSSDPVFPVFYSGTWLYPYLSGLEKFIFGSLSLTLATERIRDGGVNTLINIGNSDSTKPQVVLSLESYQAEQSPRVDVICFVCYQQLPSPHPAAAAPHLLH